LTKQKTPIGKKRILKRAMSMEQTMSTPHPRILILILMLILATHLTLPYASAADCTKTSTGLVPLTDMGSTTYKGKQGGLYPGGNTLASEVQEADLEIARHIRPLDREGNPDDETGKIGFLSIGMSITSTEFSAFKGLTEQDPLRNPKVTIVDGAFSGATSSAIGNPEGQIYWNAVNIRLNESSVNAKQIQAVWLKDVNPPARLFPLNMEHLQADLKAIIQILKERFVNLQIIYLSSRSYGGYDITTVNPEPYAYETGFAVKWLIEDQLNGDPELNNNPKNGEVKAPLLRWGPYLWADGVNPRKEDNLSWQCSDFDDDGLHPKGDGLTKAAELLLNFVQREPTARIWYLSNEAQSNVVEPLTFVQAFPTEWIIGLAAVAVVAALMTTWFVRRRREGEEEYEEETQPPPTAR
jgi:hypothetical protein